MLENSLFIECLKKYEKLGISLEALAFISQRAMKMILILKEILE
jgi:hypothetical protein